MGTIRGTSFYTIVNGPTWSQAEANSVALGGHLVTINDSSENDYLSTTVRAEIISRYGLRYGAGTQSDSAEEWRYNPLTGFSDAAQEGNWKWSSEQANGYTNWYPGEPNSSSTDSNYAVLYFFGRVDRPNTLGKWDDTSGGQIGIAEIPLSYFSVSDLTLTEGSSGTVTITRTGGTRSTQNLTLTSSNGTATAGSDHNAISTTISFAAGETSKTISISTINDSATESTETFNLTLTASSSDTVPAQISDGTAVATINDDDTGTGNSTTANINGNNNNVVTGNGNTVSNTTVINNVTNTINNNTTNNTTTTNNITNNTTNNVTNTTNNIIGTISVDLSSLIRGATTKTDAISGSASEDVLGAGKGADKLTGGDAADQFVFNTRDRFDKRGADTITDFNPSQGDKLILSPDALPGLSDPELTTVTSKKALKAAQKSAATLIYYEPLGQLFYDQNGSSKKFGKGGLFAIRSGAPELTADHLGLLG